MRITSEEYTQLINKLKNGEDLETEEVWEEAYKAAHLT